MIHLLGSYQIICFSWKTPFAISGSNWKEETHTNSYWIILHPRFCMYSVRIMEIWTHFLWLKMWPEDSSFSVFSWHFLVWWSAFITFRCTVSIRCFEIVSRLFIKASNSESWCGFKYWRASFGFELSGG